jgi:hypothetical protein
MEFAEEAITIVGKWAPEAPVTQQAISAMRGVGTGLAYFQLLSHGSYMPHYSITHVASGYGIVTSRAIETQEQAQALLAAIAELDPNKWDISLEELQRRYHASEYEKYLMSTRIKTACEKVEHVSLMALLPVTTNKPRTPTLYTFGYLSNKTERTIAELVSLSTPLVDIRFTPNSKRWQYTQEVMKAQYGKNYIWIRELGNETYKESLSGKFTDPQIKLHNPRVGLNKLMDILEQHGHAAIFCACAKYEHCHRAFVAGLARQQYAVKVVHL